MAPKPLVEQRRLSWSLLRVLLAMLVSGCASLPDRAARAPSLALPPGAGSLLAQATVDPPAAGLSGFHLMPTGEHALQTRLELMRRARQSLDVQSYHIQDDETGRVFLRALRDAAARGVRVRLLLDDLYTAGHDELLLGLAAHDNVELRLFNPFPAGRDGLTQRFAASLFEFGRVHRRMHNKLLVVDGAMAIVGGRNIANEYFMRQPGDNFIDLDTLVVGAVLPALSSLFDQYWNSRHAWPVGAIADATLPWPAILGWTSNLYSSILEGTRRERVSVEHVLTGSHKQREPSVPEHEWEAMSNGLVEVLQEAGMA